MKQIAGNPYSHLTAQTRTRLSPTAQLLLERGLLRGAVLDFGCGTGTDVRILRDRGIAINGYDPHYAPEYPAAGQRYDTILCTHVLDVLLPEAQEGVLMAISGLLRPGGKAYFTIRRDVVKEGFRPHPVHRLPVYQAAVRLPFASLYTSKRLEICEYWPYTWLHRGNAAVHPVLGTDTLRTLIAESAEAFAIEAPEPVMPGHALILPKRVVRDYFALRPEEQMACWRMANRIKEVLAPHYPPGRFRLFTESCSDAYAAIHLMPQQASNVL